MDELLALAAALAGRPIEVVDTTDGKYVVEYLNYNHAPPVGDTPMQAVTLFINFMEEHPRATESEPTE